MDTAIYICTSTGARNNNYVVNCMVEVELKQGLTYHCPCCGASLREK
jgi:hypothetical protein